MKAVMLGAIDTPPPLETRLPRDQDLLSILVVLGVLAGAVVLYLLIDWFRSRREARRLQLKRQLAREAWEEEQSAAAQRSDGSP